MTNQIPPSALVFLAVFGIVLAIFFYSRKKKTVNYQKYTMSKLLNSLGKSEVDLNEKTEEAVIEELEIRTGHLKDQFHLGKFEIKRFKQFVIGYTCILNYRSSKPQSIAQESALTLTDQAPFQKILQTIADIIVQQESFDDLYINQANVYSILESPEIYLADVNIRFKKIISKSTAEKLAAQFDGYMKAAVLEMAKKNSELFRSNLDGCDLDTIQYLKTCVGSHPQLLDAVSKSQQELQQLSIA